MNVLILVRTLEQHADIVNLKGITLGYVDENARLDELLNCDLTATLFRFNNQTRFTLESVKLTKFR